MKNWIAKDFNKAKQKTNKVTYMTILKLIESYKISKTDISSFYYPRAKSSTAKAQFTKMTLINRVNTKKLKMALRGYIQAERIKLDELESELNKHENNIL